MPPLRLTAAVVALAALCAAGMGVALSADDALAGQRCTKKRPCTTTSTGTTSTTTTTTTTSTTATTTTTTTTTTEPTPSRLGTLEPGDFSEFDQANSNGGGTLANVGDRAYEGTRSAWAATPANATGSTKYARLQWHDLRWGAGSAVRYGAAFYLPTGFRSSIQSYLALLRWDTYVWGGDNSQVSRSGVVMWSDGRYRLIAERSDIKGQTVLVGPFDLPEGRWFTLEVRQRLSETDGWNEVWVDGQPIGAASGKNYYGVSVKQVRYGIVALNDSAQSNAVSLGFDRAFTAQS